MSDYHHHAPIIINHTTPPQINRIKAMSDYSSMEKADLIVALSCRDAIIRDNQIPEINYLSEKLKASMEENKRLTNLIEQYKVEKEELTADIKVLRDASLLGQEVKRLKDVAKKSFIYHHWLAEKQDAQRREDDAEKRASLLAQNEYLISENEQFLEALSRLHHENAEMID